MKNWKSTRPTPICVTTDLYILMGPYGMPDFKNALHELVNHTKVGI